MLKYFPHTMSDLEEMKKTLHIQTLDDLFKDIPQSVRWTKDYDLKEAMSETEIRNYFESLAQKTNTYKVFSGLGFYDHYEPALIKDILSRQEFLTAYTPYQPEVAQGTLTYIFEYQSMIQTLTGMDTSNASMYDGTTATAEAMFMAESITRRKRCLIASNVHPMIVDVVKTYAHYKGLEVELVSSKEGLVDREDLSSKLDEKVACFIVQKPNFYGLVESFHDIADLVHQNKSIFIENADISSLGLLTSPKDDGADIAVGDCQSLGMPLSYGGPTLGYMATLKQHVRKMPGRICGMSYDSEGRRAFVLTLQAREQHIRREKANSNICSNQSLMALYATVYLSVMGPNGIRKVNELSYQNAHYLHDRLLQTGKFKDVFNAPFLKEFVMETLLPSDLIQKALTDKGYFGAVSLENFGEGMENLVNFAATEKRTKAEIDEFISILEGLSW